MASCSLSHSEQSSQYPLEILVKPYIFWIDLSVHEYKQASSMQKEALEEEDKESWRSSLGYLVLVTSFFLLLISALVLVGQCVML